MLKVTLPMDAKVFYALGILCSSYLLITLRKAKNSVEIVVILPDGRYVSCSFTTPQVHRLIAIMMEF